jgi:small-conductance mechanosensitive channel
MNSSNASGRRQRGFLVALLLLAASRAAAQVPVPKAAPSVTAKVDTGAPAPQGGAPAVLLPAEIPLRAPATQVRLLELEGLAARDPAVVRIEEQVGPFLDTLQAQAEAERTMASRQRTRRALLDILLEWERREIQISESQHVLRARVTQIDAGRAELDSIRGLWTRTLAEADQRHVPPEVREQARQIVVEADRVDGRLRVRQSALLAVEVRLSNAHLLVNGRKAETEDALVLERRRLFQMDTPPIWEAWPQVRVGLGEAVVGRWREGAQALQQFAGFYSVRLALQAIGAVLLIVLILALRRGVRALPPGSASLSAQEEWLLAHPFAASLMAALIATLPLYPRAPLIVYSLAALLAALPLLMVLPTLLPAALRRPAYGVSLLFLVYRVTWSSLESTDWERYAQFLLEVGLLSLLLVGLRPAGSLRALRTGWPRLHTVAVLGTAMVLVAIGADVVGNVSLAHTIDLGLLSLPALALLLLAAARIANGILAIALHLGATQLRFVRHHGAAIERRASQLVNLAAVGAWIATALFVFYLWNPVRDGVIGLLGARWQIGHASASLGTVLLFVVTVAAGAILGKWIALVLEMDLLDRLALPRGVAVTVASLIRYTLVAIAFFFALAAAGFEVGQLAIIGGALGVGVGFGLQTIVNNFISGLILAFERPIAVGDVVEVGTLAGEVREIGIRASVIRTADGAEVVVPNGQLISEAVINWTRSDLNRRIIVPVGVAYGADPRRVMELLHGAATQVSGILGYPEPDVVFKGLGESSLDFSVRVWTRVVDWVAVNSELTAAIYTVLRDAGIEIPFPQRDLHLRSLDPEVAERLRGPSAGQV